MKKRTLLAVLMFSLLLSGFSVRTAGAANEPLVLRRQTLIVRDIDQSLSLYRDALGMTLIYDQVIRRPRPSGAAPQQIRLVFLKATDEYIGVLGLVDYQYDDHAHPDHAKPIRQEGFTPGNSVVMFNTNDLASRWDRITKVKGVKVISPPVYREYPNYGGAGVIRVTMSSFYDPDGFIVEFNQPIDAIDPGQR